MDSILLLGSASLAQEVLLPVDDAAEPAEVLPLGVDPEPSSEK